MTLVLLALGLTFVLSLPAGYQLVKGGRIDPLSPLILFTFFTFSGFVVPLVSFLAEEDPFTRHWFLSYEDETSVAWALFYATLGVLGFYAGYGSVSALSRRLPARSTEYAWDSGPFKVVAAVYGVIGLLMFGMGVLRVGGVGTLLGGMVDRIRLFAGLNYFFSAINLLLVVSLVWWSYLLRTGSMRSVGFWCFTVFAVGASSLQGSKSIGFVFLLTMLSMYHRMRRPLRLAWLIVTAGVLIVVTTFYQVVMREYFAVGEFVTIDANRPTMEAVGAIISREFMGHFMQLQMLTILVERVPSIIPFQGGETFLALLTAAVPSSIMPDKYMPATGVIANYIWPEAWYVRGTTIPPGMMGEMYLNFGGIGIVAGLGVFGSFYSFLHRLWQRNPQSPWRVFIYSLCLAMMLHYLRGEVVSPTVMLLLLGVPAYVGYRMVWRKVSPGGQEVMPESHVPPSEVQRTTEG